MKKFDFKAILPHIIAVVIFLIIAVIFCKPGLDHDLILKQSDISGWRGMSHQAFEYKDIHGHPPLWLTNMFSGMPAYQVVLEGAWSPLSLIDRLMQLWLPQPMNFFFLACICFYFMCICFGVRSYAAIAGAIGFAYCSFSPIIITAGHNSQMLALAYAPSVIGAVMLLFRKKYVLGFTLTAILTSLQIAQGHQQISFYLFLILIALTINYIIAAIKKNDTSHLLKSIGLMAVAGIMALAVNAITLWPTYDYANESKRGGQLIMDPAKKQETDNGKTKGLSKDYAFQWSYGKMETFSLLFPGVMGYGTHYAERDGEPYMFPQLGENSHVINYLTEKLNVPPSNADQISSYMSQQLYWGDQPFTNGPVYLGAVICFLFVLGLFILDNKNKWWILSIVVIGILLSWGKNFPGFNNFIFDHFPLYNKFRVPTMTLVIPQLLAPLMGALVLSKLMENNDPELWKKFRTGLMATAGLFIIGLGIYATSDFSQENRERTKKFNEIYNDPAAETKMNALNAEYPALKDNTLYESMVANFKSSGDAPKIAREVVSEIRKDRAGLFGGDIIRSFIYVLIAAALIGIYIRKIIPQNAMVAGVILVIAIDLLSFGGKYLNDKSFDSKDKYEADEFPMSKADEQIKKDPDPNFRVFNLTGGDPFQESRTSYYHKSIGGYHPAKLGIYDDLATYQLNGSPNINVLNMLNTKYVIQRQGNELFASQNPGALGNCWFVKGYTIVHGAVEEMKAISNFNPKDTAVIDQKFAGELKNISAPDSTATIKMTHFENDAITYQSSSSSTNLAVFSEIFYKDWKATIDGNPATILKANYVLRALVVPAGNHTIEFKFLPRSFYLGKTISNIASWLVFILLFIGIFIEWRNLNKTSV